MEHRIAHLEMRNDEIWDLLEDPTLPPLDRRTLGEEMLRNIVEIVLLEGNQFDDDDESTITFESESIGPDEYEREGLIANDDFDLANEV